MIGMQGNFNPPMMNMNMNMNNMAPIHPNDDQGEQDMATEILNISKIKEGFYIGDKISAISLDVIIQFKITHMINATGNQIMNQWESIGIAYLTLNWSETPKQILFDSKDEIANRIVEFIDGSLIGKGEGILAHSFKGQNRVCIVVLIYLMKKYKWSLNKSMQYLKSKKQDVDIPIYFFEQLKNFENRLRQRGELPLRDIPWEFEELPDPEEKLLRNTYLNGVKVEINNNIIPNRKNNLRRIMWADTNPYQKSILELNNSENDLFYQKNLRPITVHQSERPKRGCIKGMNKNNMNKIGVNMQNNSLNNLNIINNNNLFKAKSNNTEIINKNIEEYKNNFGIPKNNNIFSSQQVDNNWNNMNIPNITALRGDQIDRDRERDRDRDRNIMNNNYFNQNNNNNINNIPYNKNINLIATGKFNSMNDNINDNNPGNSIINNSNNNNINNKKGNNINNNLNNMNRFNPQQQQSMITGKKNNTQINAPSPDNFLNKERNNNNNNMGRGNNMMDLRINNSVNIKESSYNMNSLNSLNPNNINYYNMHNSYNNAPQRDMNPALPVSNSIQIQMNPNMLTFGKQQNNMMNMNGPKFNNNNNPSPFRSDNNNNPGFMNNNKTNISQFRNENNNNPGFMNNDKSNVSPFRNNNNNNPGYMNKNNNNISPFRNGNNNNAGYIKNNKNKNNISPFRNDNENNPGYMNNNRNNNNISPFHNNNDNSAGFLNNRQNIGLNNNYIKNKNNNTATNFYKENQFQNMINYTPLVKERGIGDNNSNNNTSNSSNNKNKNIFSQKNQPMTNYNPVNRFSGRPMSSGGNNFNKNIGNQNRMNNNFSSNNKPLNNFNPNLIKHKETTPSLLNKNKNSGPIKIKNNNYINNLSKKPNTPDLNHYYSTGTGFMDNNGHNRFKYNGNNNKKDIKNNTMSNGFGYPMANNYNRKMGIQRPSTAPKKEKNNFGLENNNKINRNNQYGNNFTKPTKFNQRPSSAGGKNKNGYGYSNNINKNGIGKNLNNNMNKNKKNMGIGINKRLPSPQIYSNSNGLGFNSNNYPNKNKFNPAKHRMPSPVIKSNNIMKRPPLPNSGPRIHANKNDKFN